MDNSNHFPGASRKQTMLGELRIFSLKGLESGVDNHQFSSSSQWLRMAPRGPGAFILPSSPPLAHTPTPGQLFLHASQAHAYYLSESCESGMQKDASLDVGSSQCKVLLGLLPGALPHCSDRNQRNTEGYVI